MMNNNAVITDVQKVPVGLIYFYILHVCMNSSTFTMHLNSLCMCVYLIQHMLLN